ncbi:class I SAM-dependent methyltransferase [Micromonospora olivasterospora]|uniref:class I SAM-dependent methyltransferase n=1 Tax=Micromonospora olivasterospora TaxID=1880 RepID=UPI001FE5FEA6|nr:hypothetical protein [Micromonospora olivasterospora]
MIEQTEAMEIDRAVQTRHRQMWALGDYAALAAQIIPELGTVLVRAAGVGPGDRVLDVAAGTGNAAIPAALAGASVVASDLTPELLAAGRHHRPAQLDARRLHRPDVRHDEAVRATAAAGRAAPAAVGQRGARPRAVR